MTASLGFAFKQATIAGAHSTNAGLWSAVFTPSDIDVALPTFECYRIVIANGPPGSTFQIFVGNRRYDSVFPGDTNSWDPNNPMKLNNGDTVAFYWNSNLASAQPEVWLYFQESRPL